MNNVYVNGRIETIANDRDVVDIIRECCGDDFARYVENRLNCRELTEEEIKQVLENSDYYSYEASLDAWNCVGNDIVEECEKQIEYMEEAKKINKDRLYNAFVDIRKMIKNVLELCMLGLKNSSIFFYFIY